MHYAPMDPKQMTEWNIGKPVMRNDRGYFEYGVITGFVKNLVLVHFGSNVYSLRLRPQDLFMVTVKKR